VARSLSAGIVRVAKKPPDGSGWQALENSTDSSNSNNKEQLSDFIVGEMQCPRQF
jgi:hypothetical protein